MMWEGMEGLGMAKVDKFAWAFDVPLLVGEAYLMDKDDMLVTPLVRDANNLCKWRVPSGGVWLRDGEVYYVVIRSVLWREFAFCFMAFF